MTDYFEGLVQYTGHQEEIVKQLEKEYMEGKASLQKLVNAKIELHELYEEIDKYSEEDGLFL